MKGDIIVYKPNGIIGRLIKLISGDNFIHAAMFISKDKIIEATYKGIQINKYKYYKGVEIYSFSNLLDEDREKLIQYSISKVNKMYDYPLLFTIMYEKWFNKKAIDKSNAYICSEFIRDMYYTCLGIKVHNKENPTPQQLRDNLLYLSKDITSDVIMFNYVNE